MSLSESNKKPRKISSHECSLKATISQIQLLQIKIGNAIRNITNPRSYFYSRAVVLNKRIRKKRPILS